MDMDVFLDLRLYLTVLWLCNLVRRTVKKVGHKSLFFLQNIDQGMLIFRGEGVVSF